MAAIAVAVLILTGAHSRLLSLDVSPAEPDRIGPPPALTVEAGSSPMGRAEDHNPQWTLVRHNVNDGAVLDGPSWTVDGGELIAVRLLSWNPLGEPVIAAFAREPNAPARGIGQLGYNSTHSVRVDTLSAAGPRPLISAPHLIMSIDVADDAIAGGLVWHAESPTTTITSVLAHPAVPLLAIILILLGWRGRHRLRVWAAKGWPGQNPS